MTVNWNNRKRYYMKKKYKEIKVGFHECVIGIDALDQKHIILLHGSGWYIMPNEYLDLTKTEAMK
jgi:hypothetical protein